jgi:ketosteroid isomerase-like protein
MTGSDVPAWREGMMRLEDDMKTTNVSDLVRRYFAAYEAKDREALGDLLADDFTFTSPYDDHIDRKVYFERCWPNSANMRSFRVVKLFEQGDEAFILYEGQFKGSEIVRNTEFFRTEGGRIKAVEVYFGSPTRSQTT